MSNSKIQRILYFLSNLNLFYFFFYIRLAKLITLFNNKKIDLTTSEMKSSGLSRYAHRGLIYYSYLKKSYPAYVATGNAVDNIKNTALNYCKGAGLDIGCKLWPLPGAYPVDNNANENAYELSGWSDNSLDYIFSSHCLEHLSEWESALTLWSKKIKRGGLIFLYLPHPDMTLWQPGSPWVGNDHVWSPTWDTVTNHLKHLGLTIIGGNSSEDNYFSFHIVAVK
jgi:hypothetical protein